MFDIFTLTSYPGATKVNSINEAQELTKTRYCWILDDRNDYSNFDFLWEPAPWEANQSHVWPSQHQENGGTRLVPKQKYTDTNYHTEEIPRTRFPKIVHLDHGNGFDPWLAPTTGMYLLERSRFINDYLGTLKRVVQKNIDCGHLWVISSVCSYRDFDFTWHPSEWQQDMLHVFPSNEQKFGDTFLINVEDFLKQSKALELLEWYDTICFQDTIVHRATPSMYLHQHDNQVDAMKSAIFQKIEDPSEFNDPVTLFTTSIEGFDDGTIPTINLWRPETRAITPLDKGAKRVLVPREALTEVHDQLYDYKYIDKSHNDDYKSSPIDIVFMSNGESCAQENYDRLCEVADGYEIHWVKDVEGRIASAREAARVSNTDWFFSVNAKLKVDRDFDWDWQPDCMQAAKHYIFYAYNPLTDDTYGHMATIAWNKNLVNTDTDWGLDFTMSHEHEVIPVLSGEAIYADEPWAAWRTAFREVIKLQLDDGMESSLHLKKWLAANDEWTAKGANDAVDFFKTSNGDMDKLLLSFDWEWLAKYYYIKYITY